MTVREINFDGIVGPSHNYGGLSLGNLASTRNAGVGQTILEKHGGTTQTKQSAPASTPVAASISVGSTAPTTGPAATAAW